MSNYFHNITLIPRISSNRYLPNPSTYRYMPRPAIDPPLFAYIPSKLVTLGSRVNPFGGLVLIIEDEKDISQIRWQKDGGGWTTLSVSTYTDLVAEARFLSETINVFGTSRYDLEVTDEEGLVWCAQTYITCKMYKGSSKHVARSTYFRPFSDFLICYDPNQISSISYSINGDTTVAKTPITRRVLYSGTHDGLNNASTLTDSTKDFDDFHIIEDTDILKNITDGSEGVITDVDTTELTATLSGGTDDDWDTGDTYNIVDGGSIEKIAKRFYYQLGSAGIYQFTLYVSDLSLNEASASVSVFVA